MSIREDYSLEVEDVSFSYNQSPVLEKVSFSVKDGEYLGIIGPNGGGKTTLIKIILGLLTPDSGQVKIFGRDLKDFREKALIGYVPQRASQTVAQFPATVEEIVQSGRTARVGILRRFRPSDWHAIEKAMIVADVNEYKTKILDELSGGERQRVFIARALAGGPKILILDEPSIGIDLTSQEKFYSFIEHLNQDQGLTIIFISHDIDVVAHEAKSLLCLNKNLVCHASPRETIKEGYLEKLYGKKVKFVLHGH